jgi:hypothetical protein
MMGILLSDLPADALLLWYINLWKILGGIVFFTGDFYTLLGNLLGFNRFCMRLSIKH